MKLGNKFQPFYPSAPSDQPSFDGGNQIGINNQPPSGEGPAFGDKTIANDKMMPVSGQPVEISNDLNGA